MARDRGNKAVSKADHLLSPQEKVQFEDYGQLNRMLSDLQPEQKSPKTGYALSKILKNPVSALIAGGGSLLAPKTAIGIGAGSAINRQLSKSLRSRKNLKHYLKPELLDEIIRKKMSKKRSVYPFSKALKNTFQGEGE
jgi:hypothetical protein